MVSLFKRASSVLIPIRALVFITVMFFSFDTHAQFKTVKHRVVFESQSQSMWGATNFNINRKINFFERFETGFAFDSRPSSITSIAGLKFGAGIYANFAFGIGPLVFKIDGFEGGSVGVIYPIKTSLELPEDSSFNAGETITIETDYIVEDDYKLNTAYPATGDISLEMPIKFDMRAGVDICLFECFSFMFFPEQKLIIPGIPNTSTYGDPIIDMNWIILKVNKDTIVYPCMKMPPELPMCIKIIPPGSFSSILPPESAISGSIKIPHVTTTASISGKDLIAKGSDNYINPSLDIIKLLSFAPGVGPYFALVSSSLQIPPNGIKDLSGVPRTITLSWTLFTMSLDVPIYQNQEFRFHPTVNLKLQMPVPVVYNYVNVSTGRSVDGRDSIIDVPLGSELKIQYPCNMSHMDMHASYVIFTNEFSNRTYDHVDIELTFSAFKFGVFFPDFVIIPEMCLNIPFIGELCIGLKIPAFTVIDIGPLVNPPPLHIAGFDLPDYFNRTWELPGFTKQVIAEPFRLVPRKIRMDLVANNAVCFGSATGTATFDVTGVTAPLTYEWSTGSTAKDLSNAPAGRQYVTATDVNKCRVHADAFIGQPDPILTSVSASNLLCYNDLTGAASVTASGGIPSYSYKWTNRQSSSTATALPAGKHTVTVTDANGCEQVDSILLTQPPDIRAAVVHAVNPSCFGKADGSILLDVSGGVQPYFYQWTNGASDKDIRLLAGGAYTVNLRDANGCTRDLSTTLIEPAPLVINLSLLSDVACLGGRDGSILANVTGGTLPYRYAWKDADAELSNVSNLISGLPAGIYSLAVEDKNMCIADNNLEITAPQFILESSVTKTNLSCYNGSDGKAQVQVTGGTSPYLISWSNGLTGPEAVNLAAGTYTITVVDSKKCTLVNKAVIASPAPINISIKEKNISCADQQDGSLTATVSNGEPPYSYQWSTGSTGSFLQDLASGVYTLTITDQKNCIATADARVETGNGDCLFIPDAFSPNNDGVNDRWVLRNIRLYPGNSMQVFNQWGQQLYSATPYLEPWDGRHNGNLLPPATYYYIFSRGDGSPSVTHALTIIK